MVPIFHGQRLMLRSAVNVVFSNEFPRSPIARFPLWVLCVFCSSVSSPPFGFLNATVMVSASPS